MSTEKSSERDAFEAWEPTYRPVAEWQPKDIMFAAFRAGVAYARAALPQQAQEPSLSTQGAEPDFSAMSRDRLEQECREYREAFYSATRLAQSYFDQLQTALAASPAPAPQEPAARFLLVAMDDDGCGNPVFCADEKAVRAALAPLLFFFNDEHPLSAEHDAEVDAQLEALLEDGFLRFEGDPGINLYKLHAPLYASPAPGELGAVDAAAVDAAAAFARLLREEAAALRREGEGCADGRYEWMAAGVEAAADTLLGVDSATGKTVIADVLNAMAQQAPSESST